MFRRFDSSTTPSLFFPGGLPFDATYRLSARINSSRDHGGFLGWWVSAILAKRLDLILSVDGVGLPTALAILARMPEIGRITREQAASLAGLAPFDDASAEREGERHIAGGRARLRERLYAASLPAAMLWNPELMALYQRLTAAGKPHKVALVACARKLLIFVNTVVERGTPWVSKRRSAALGIAT